MTNHLRIAGSWPAPVTITRGWAKARARRWNPDLNDGYLRLERGSKDFLAECVAYMSGLGLQGVYSPALHPTSTRVWNATGFEPTQTLDIMERSLSLPFEPPPDNVASIEPIWNDLYELDKQCFRGFWRLGPEGLAEAATATTNHSVVAATVEGQLAGFAVAGAQWGVGYLQRICVLPNKRGAGLGSGLVRSAMTWCRSAGATSIVLNVAPDNAEARSLYERERFVDTKSPLSIMRYAFDT